MEQPDISSLEQTRLARQAVLDASKTLLERNRLGQFATPALLAAEITRFAVSCLEDGSAPFHFCDPAVSTSAFVAALLTLLPSEFIGSAWCVEIDPPFARACQELWGCSGLRVAQGDFTQMDTMACITPQPKLIVTNPPYVRHH